MLGGLLRGVRDLHAKGIAHRDLKGANIHVTADHRCKLLDVGSAGSGPTRYTVPACTISHRVPDLLQAEIRGGPYAYEGIRLDMWSVGVLILELLVGPHPFGHIHANISAEQMLANLQEKKPAVLAALQPPLCTPDQRTVLIRCLDDHPKNRPEITEVLDAFVL